MTLTIYTICAILFLLLTLYSYADNLSQDSDDPAVVVAIPLAALFWPVGVVAVVILTITDWRKR